MKQDLIFTELKPSLSLCEVILIEKIKAILVHYANKTYIHTIRVIGFHNGYRN